MSDDDDDVRKTTAASRRGRRNRPEASRDKATATPCRGRRKRPEASRDKATATPVPAKKRQLRRPEVVLANRRVNTALRPYHKNDEVEVLYEGKWWKATILFLHRGKYAVKYCDDNCEEAQIPASRIRPRK